MFSIDDSDFSQWQAELADVQPQSQRGKRFQTKKEDVFDDIEELDILPLPKEKPALKEEIKEVVAPVLFQASAEASPRHNVVVHTLSADKISGSANGIDPRTMKKLATGQIPFVDRLDLHGFYETAAWAATQDFLNECYQAEHRCVLIVHGKGKGYGEKKDMGIIKANMAGWLVNHPRVLAFHTAIPRDGGRGAIYVYLKRVK